MTRSRKPLPPLDPAALERLALRYVERFATTRGRLAAYLGRKLRERGWAPEAAPPDPAAVAERMAALGYVDDAAFAQARAGALARRGIGERRVRADLRSAGVDADAEDWLADAIAAQALDAALAFARRRRIGPFGDGDCDRQVREKQLGAMLRAGHPLDLARRIIRAAPGEAPEMES